MATLSSNKDCSSSNGGPEHLNTKLRDLRLEDNDANLTGMSPAKRAKTMSLLAHSGRSVQLQPISVSKCW